MLGLIKFSLYRFSPFLTGGLGQSRSTEYLHIRHRLKEALEEDSRFSVRLWPSHALQHMSSTNWTQRGFKHLKRGFEASRWDEEGTAYGKMCGEICERMKINCMYEVDNLIK